MTAAAAQTEAVVRERPIIFSAPMVRAILSGAKTQTRRVVKYRVEGPNPPRDAPTFDWYDRDKWVGAHRGDGLHRGRRDHVGRKSETDNALNLCPYGKPGDRLWVRETFAQKAWGDRECLKGGSADAPAHPTETYLGEPMRAIYRATWPEHLGDAGPWKPSIYMPRWASRITLEVTNVRVERVQEISPEDARAEGAWRSRNSAIVSIEPPEFADLWDSINSKRPGCAWADNPFVWALTFRRLNNTPTANTPASHQLTPEARPPATHTATETSTEEDLEATK